MSYRDESKVLSSTKYVVSVQITKIVTAGIVSSGAALVGRAEVIVPASTDTIVQWASEGPDLDALVDKTHRVVSLYGGDVTPVDPFVKPDER